MFTAVTMNIYHGQLNISFHILYVLWGDSFVVKEMQWGIIKQSNYLDEIWPF